MSRRIRQAQDTLIAAEAARLDPLKRPPVNLSRIKAGQLATELGRWAVYRLRDFGHKPPYHIADVVDMLDTHVWSDYWPESARRAFAAALIGTPEVTADMSVKYCTAISPAVTADMAVRDAYRSWRAYGDTICDVETSIVHHRRRRLAIAAAIAELRKIV